MTTISTVSAPRVSRTERRIANAVSIQRITVSKITSHIARSPAPAGEVDEPEV